MRSRTPFHRRLALFLTPLVAAALLIPYGVSAAAADPVETMSGTGPYDAQYDTSLRLRDHTIYRPSTLPDDEQLPIVAWGNGACLANGTMFEDVLLEFASHGFLVIASGRPNGSGRTDADMLIDAVDWAVAENERAFSKYRGKIDTDNIAVMGQSCGGLETYEVADDPRIDTTVLWNSGLLDPSDTHLVENLHAPVAYFTGGPTDIAHRNALEDWGRLPEELPAFLGALDVGHSGTFGEPNGGEYGRVGTAWLQWHLKDDAEAAREFVGDDCGLCDTDWEVEQQNLD